MKNLSTQLKIALGVLLGVIVLSGASFGTYLYLENKKANETKELANETKKLAERIAAFQVELRHGLVRGCERNGNKLRKVVRALILDDLQNAENISLYRDLFPSTPASKLRELSVLAIKKYKERLTEAHNIECAKQYPSPKHNQKGVNDGEVESADSRRPQAVNNG